MANPLEQIISVVSPRWAAKRQLAKVALNQLRGYEAASTGRRTSSWYAPSSSSAAETENAVTITRNRMRQQVRDNPWASKAINVIVHNTIGTGIIATPLAKNSRTKDAAGALWKEWAESTECDALGKLNLYGLQGLILRTIVESGEVLVIREMKPSNKSVPIALRICEPDHIDQSRDGSQPNGDVARRGIQYNASGVVTGYWLFPEHPGDRMSFGYFSRTSEFISADRVVHSYKIERPGQTRGIPWGVSCMIRLRELDEYEDAQLVKQKVSACYTAFVTDMDSELTNPNGGEISEKLEPGAIEILPPGRDMKFATPPSTTGYSEYVKNVLHSIAAGFGITYEALTGDLSNVNFSSGRMGWLEFSRNVESWRWNVIVPQVLNPIWDWFLMGATLTGRSFDGTKVDWTPPRREMIDPKSEIPPIKDSIRAGLLTLSEAQRMFGFDPTKLMAEYASDMKNLDALGITLDVDVRKVANNGSLQQDNTDPAADAALRGLAEALKHG